MISLVLVVVGVIVAVVGRGQWTTNSTRTMLGNLLMFDLQTLFTLIKKDSFSIGCLMPVISKASDHAEGLLVLISPLKSAS